MNVKQPKATQQARSEKTLGSIIAACDELLASKSFEQISMQEIAKTAGVSVGNLYNRFEDKDALVDYVLESYQGTVLQQLNRSLSELPPDLDLQEKFLKVTTILAAAVGPIGPVFASLAARQARGKTVSAAAQGNSDLLVDTATAWLVSDEETADEARCRFAIATIAFSLQFDVVFGTPGRIFGKTLIQQLSEQAYLYATA